MSRLRLNSILGTLASNPVTISATGNTCTWTTAPNFPAISAPDYAVLIFEPDTANEEICWLIGYTPGSTTGLVQRAAESSTGGCALNSPVAHSNVAWVHGPTAKDFMPYPARMISRALFR